MEAFISMIIYIITGQMEAFISMIINIITGQMEVFISMIINMITGQNGGIFFNDNEYNYGTNEVDSQRNLVQWYDF